MDKAHALVAEKKYNEAILYLTKLVKENPEYMDEAEKIIGQIRLIRSEYNKKYEQLIDVLFEKHDVAKALQLIEELQKLDPNPNKATIEAIAKAKRGAEIVFNLNRFKKIMDKAFEQLQGDRYLDAIQTYLSGYDIHKGDFDNASYGKIVKESVNSALKKLMDASNEFLGIADSTSKQFDEISLLVAGTNVEELKNKIDSYIPNLKKIVFDIVTIERAATVFKETNRIISEKNRINQGDYFLHYAYMLTEGRSPEKDEGLKNAIERYFDGRILFLKGKLLESGELNFTKAKRLFSKGDYKEAISLLQVADTFYKIYQNLDIVLEARIAVGRKMSMNDEAKTLIRTNIPNYLRVVERQKEVNTYEKLIEISTRMPKPSESALRDLAMIKRSRGEIGRIKKEINNLKEKWQGLIEYYSAMGKMNYDTVSTTRDALGVVSKLNEVYSDLIRLDIQFVNAENLIEYEDIANTLESFKKEYAEGTRLKDGYDVIVDRIKDSEGKEVTITRHERYPSEAIKILNSLRANIGSLKKKVDQFIIRVKSDTVLSKDKEEQKKWIEKSEKLKSTVLNLENNIENTLAEANDILILAKRYENEGQLRLREAESALKRNNFKRAKDSVALSGKAFATSLSYEENPEIRHIMDSVLPELSQIIIKQENLFVVREVRQLINEGRRYFGLGDYVKAEEILLKAKARWEDTNSIENKEITNWLNIVRSALSVKSGREISEKDPLYTEMTQLLNYANKDYLDGAKLLEEKRKVEALKRFQSALEKIQRVKLAFPYNRDARVLALKIQKLSDPENFSASLTKFYNEAIKNAKSNPKESYADLKDIEEIKPDYPGLKRAIYNLEVLLGIRIPKPDPKKIAESERLYDQAYKIVASNRIDLFPAALDQLNRAIELDPNNEKAIALKDRIQIAAGGTVQAVLSSYAEEQYRLAENKYLEGKYFEALAIVERLLRDKRNRNYPPLIELKKRIETKI